MWWAGQAQGLIHDIDTCENVVNTILTDAQTLIRKRLPALVDA